VKGAQASPGSSKLGLHAHTGATVIDGKERRRQREALSGFERAGPPFTWAAAPGRRLRGWGVLASDCSACAWAWRGSPKRAEGSLGAQ
jgi:hypothetical protein